MDSDFRPVRRPSVKSLRASLDARSQATENKTEDFKTPEQVAATQPEPSVALDLPEKPQPTKADLRARLSEHWPPSRRALIIGGLSLVFVIGIVGTILHLPKKPVASAKPAKAVVKVAPQPTTVPSTLSGLPVDPSVNRRPVTGVMIENSLFARPQSGLGQASVVFEAIAEGGITRFLALYQDTQPTNIGPIRSARPYYAQWALGFDASLAHVGGSPEALADIKAWGVKDLDQFHNGGSYHRISSRAAPHNVYTAVGTLNQLEASKGFGASQFSGFPRKKEAPAKTLTVTTIALNLSGPDYNVNYDYDAASNSYKRKEALAPHIDADTKAQISPKVVVAMVIPYSLEKDGYHSDYAVIGSGPVDIFQDGTLTTGTWTKTANNTQITFADAAGKTIKLDPGQTWLTAVSATAKVAYH